MQIELELAIHQVTTLQNLGGFHVYANLIGCIGVVELDGACSRAGDSLAVHLHFRYQTAVQIVGDGDFDLVGGLVGGDAVLVDLIFHDHIVVSTHLVELLCRKGDLAGAVCLENQGHIVLYQGLVADGVGAVGLVQIKLELAIHQVTTLQNLGSLQSHKDRICNVGVVELDLAVCGDVLVAGDLCQNAANFHLGNSALVQLLVGDGQHTAAVLHHLQAHVVRRGIVIHILRIAPHFDDLVVVDARCGQLYCREFKRACTVVLHRLPDLLAVDGIDQHEFELARFHGTAGQYLFTAKVCVDVIGDRCGHKAVAEYDTGCRHVILLHFHTGSEHASGIVGNGDRDCVNGCIVIIPLIAAIQFCQGVDIHAGLFVGDLAEVDHALGGIGHRCRSRHGSTCGHSGQAELEFAVLHGLAGEDLLALQLNIHRRSIVHIGEQDLIHRCAGLFDLGDVGAEGCIAVVHYGYIDLKHSLVIGEAADGIVLHFGNHIDIGVTLVGIGKLDGGECKIAACLIGHGGDAGHGSICAFCLDSEREFACIQYPLAANGLVAGDGDEVRRRGNIGVGEDCLAIFHSTVCRCGDNRAGGDGAVAVVLYGDIHLVNGGVIADVGVAGVNFCQIVGKHSAFHSCPVGGVVQGKARLAIDASHMRTHDLGSLCQVIGIQQYKLEACQAVVAIHLLLHSHSHRSRSGGLINIVEGCSYHIRAGHGGICLVVDRHDLQIAVHIAVGHNHAEAPLCGIVCHAALSAHSLGNTVVVSARLGVILGG